MSVQSNTYVIVGVKLEYEHFSEEQEEDLLEPYKDSAYSGIHHHNGLCVISDGMSGNYIIAGRVLAKSVDERGEGIDMTECDTSPELFAEVAGLLTEHLSIENPEVQVLAFTHYR
jgi:hypothetical protein